MLRIRCGEFNVLCTLRHPHIVNVLNFWTSDNEAVLAMELHSQSNLQDVVRRSSTLDEATSKSLFQRLVLKSRKRLPQQKWGLSLNLDNTGPDITLQITTRVPVYMSPILEAVLEAKFPITIYIQLYMLGICIHTDR